jgi:hypothetical protein
MRVELVGAMVGMVLWLVCPKVILACSVARWVWLVCRWTWEQTGSM